MNKQGKKLLALILALAMSLQWLPALADEPTVTVNGTAATVDAGDETQVVIVSWQGRELPKDGDIKIEDGIAYMWHADIADWAPVLNNDGNPVSPEGYTETVAYTQSLSITISGNYVPAVDSETGKRLKTP